jgi:hypothetical protein
VLQFVSWSALRNIFQFQGNILEMLMSQAEKDELLLGQVPHNMEMADGIS